MTDLRARVGGRGRSQIMPPGGVPEATGWTDVTPGGVTMDPNGTAAGTGNNFGAQGAIADPTQPGVVYVPVTYQGLWKSTDYGKTFTKVTVAGSDPMQNGRPNLRVAIDGSYIISTALYPIGGISNGAWKSLNGGSTWTRYAVGAPNGDDLGAFEILDSDVNRVITVSHSSPFNMYESRDAGQTWTDQGTMPGSRGGGADAIWLDTDTILAIGDGDNGSGPGTYRGVRSGSSWPWTWTWTSVDNQQHWHGVSQLYRDPVTSAIFTGGAFGVRKSTNNGVSWSQVSSTYSATVVGTATTLYSMAHYASQGGFGPFYQTASRPGGGTSWSGGSAPGGLNNGPLYWAVFQNPAGQWVLVGGHWNAGFWRYVEP